jgi:PAS domain S-box-containing protein
MKLQTKLLLVTGAILSVIISVSLFVSFRAFDGQINDEMTNDARNIRAMLMATRRVYHLQFVASGLPVDDKTIGFIPANALSRISKDFPNWGSQTGLSFNNVSDRPRNPANRADIFELEAMAWFRANPKAIERVAEFTSQDGKRYYHYTAPMYIEAYCLRCHGDRDAAPPSIRERYAEAFDYKVGDLRGVISIKIPMATLREQFWAIWRNELFVHLTGFIFAFLVLGLAINRLVTLRFSRLGKVAEQIRKGDYSQRAVQDDDHDEISLLTRTINLMADAVQKRDSALKESEFRWRFAIEGSGEGLWDWNIPEGTVFFTKRWKEMLGFSEDEIENNLDERDKRLHPDDKARCYADIERHFRGETPVYENEHRVLCKDGSYKWILDRGMVVSHGRDGKPLRMIGTHTDITERKEREEDLERSNADLEQFSYAVSHDMRQPLRMVSSYLQLLERSLAGQLDGDKRDYFNYAIEGAKRIDRMLVDLLEYSRVGRKGEPPTSVESRALLDEVLQFLRPAIADAQAKVNITGEWPRIHVGRDEISRLLQNLIGNAAKFRIAGRTPEITITSKVAGNEWHLCVADNGVGIIPSQIKRLFQIFQRLQLREAYEGAGVGLALCRKIAEHHKGHIWVESEGEGQGSRFHVVLPILRGEM